MLLTRNSGGGFNAGKTFEAPLTTTLVPTRAAGSATPTFTRATIASSTDWESRVIPAISGESRFVGARRVRNYVLNSESPSVSVRGTAGATATTEATDKPAAVASAVRLTITNGATFSFQKTASSSFIGDVRRVSLWMKGEGTSIGRAVRLSVLDNGGTGGTGTTVDVVLTGSWVRYTTNVGAVQTTVGTDTAAVVGAGGSGPIQTGDTMLCAGFMSESVLGSNTNPSEYVSVGLLAAPFHGAGVDGVKYFNYQNGNSVASTVITEASGAAISSSTTLGYLAEQASTNLVLQSSGLDQAGTWVPTTCTVTPASGTAPDGTNTAFLVDSTVAGGRIVQIITLAATSFTYSFFLKQGSAATTDLLVRNNTTATNLLQATFTYATATVTKASGSQPLVSSVQTLPNGWYRISITVTAGITSGDAIWCYLYPANSSGTGSCRAWGGQGEALAFATSYIPTTTGAVPRNADVLTYPTAGNFDDATGSAYAEINYPAFAAQARVIGNGTNSSGAPIMLAAANVRFYDLTNFNASTAPNVSGGVTTKVASKWAGAAGATAAAGTVGAATAFDGTMTNGSAMLSIGTDAGGTTLNGTVRNVRIWTRALTDTELILLTT